MNFKTSMNCMGRKLLKGGDFEIEASIIPREVEGQNPDRFAEIVTERVVHFAEIPTSSLSVLSPFISSSHLNLFIL